MSKSLLVIVGLLAAVAAANAQGTNNNLGKAQGTVDKIRQPDPPSVSTGTKPSPVGQPASDYHPPAAPTMKNVDRTVVPPPSK
ncbi:MAG TPA: hypothetical protein VH640_16570 [Bryobacteraceae bacterium]|jgi:hypothetical protein